MSIWTTYTNWKELDVSPITGAKLYVHKDRTQVAACREWEEPQDSSALVSGVAPESMAQVKGKYYTNYYFRHEEFDVDLNDHDY